MRVIVQNPGRVILLIAIGSVISMIYTFHQSSAYSKFQADKFLSRQVPIQNDEILVPMEEIVKGRPIMLKQDDILVPMEEIVKGRPIMLKQDDILVPMEEIVKGRPIMLKQDEPKLLNFIRTRGYLHPPSTLEYSLANPKIDPSMGQSKAVLKVLRNMTNGFFVECGGLDGETRSNTLVLERQLGWKGLLIEADLKNFEMLLLKNRKAWAAHACLAIKPIPHEVIFKQNFNQGRIQRDVLPKGKHKNLVRVQCFPFFSLLSALNITQVDYFSLDVEGAELDVLKTIPFESIFIKVLSVEFKHIKGGKLSLKKFMAEKGYEVTSEVTHGNNLANDYIFVHKNLTVKSTTSKSSPKQKSI